MGMVIDIHSHVDQFQKDMRDRKNESPRMMFTGELWECAV